MDSLEIDQMVADHEQLQAAVQDEHDQLMVEIYVDALTVQETEEARFIAASNQHLFSIYGYDYADRIQLALERYDQKDAAGKKKFFLESVHYAVKLLHWNRGLDKNVKRKAAKIARQKAILMRVRTERNQVQQAHARMVVKRAKAISSRNKAVKELSMELVKEMGMQPLQEDNLLPRTDTKTGLGHQKGGACRRLQFSNGDSASSSSSSSSMSV